MALRWFNWRYSRISCSGYLVPTSGRGSFTIFSLRKGAHWWPFRAAKTGLKVWPLQRITLGIKLFSTFVSIVSGTMLSYPLTAERLRLWCSIETICKALTRKTLTDLNRVWMPCLRTPRPSSQRSSTRSATYTSSWRSLLVSSNHRLKRKRSQWELKERRQRRMKGKRRKILSSLRLQIQTQSIFRNSSRKSISKSLTTFSARKSRQFSTSSPFR